MSCATGALFLMKDYLWFDSCLPSVLPPKMLLIYDYYRRFIWRHANGQLRTVRHKGAELLCSHVQQQQVCAQAGYKAPCYAPPQVRVLEALGFFYRLPRKPYQPLHLVLGEVHVDSEGVRHEHYHFDSFLHDYVEKLIAQYEVEFPGKLVVTKTHLSPAFSRYHVLSQMEYEWRIEKARIYVAEHLSEKFLVGSMMKELVTWAEKKGIQVGKYASQTPKNPYADDVVDWESLQDDVEGLDPSDGEEADSADNNGFGGAHEVYAMYGQPVSAGAPGLGVSEWKGAAEGPVENSREFRTKPTHELKVNFDPDLRRKMSKQDQGGATRPALGGRITGGEIETVSEKSESCNEDLKIEDSVRSEVEIAKRTSEDRRTLRPNTLGHWWNEHTARMGLVPEMLAIRYWPKAEYADQLILDLEKAKKTHRELFEAGPGWGEVEAWYGDAAPTVEQWRVYRVAAVHQEAKQLGRDLRIGLHPILEHQSYIRQFYESKGLVLNEAGEWQERAGYLDRSFVRMCGLEAVEDYKARQFGQGHVSRAPETSGSDVSGCLAAYQQKARQAATGAVTHWDGADPMQGKAKKPAKGKTARAPGRYQTLYGQLETTWFDALQKSYPGMVFGSWGPQEYRQLGQLLEKYKNDGRVIENALCYLADNWNSIQERFLKGKGSVPTLGFLLRFHDTIVVESQMFASRDAAKQEIEAWMAANPHMVVPTELQARYQEAAARATKMASAR